jgi:hypothetical protein
VQPITQAQRRTRLAKARGAEEDVERDGRAERDHRDDDLLVGDEGAEDLDGRLGEEVRGGEGRGPVDDGEDRLDDQHDADRRDDPPGERPAGHSPGHELEPEAENSPESEHRDQRGDRPRQPQVHVEVVEGVSGDRGERALREVEDPRRLVREDQTDSGQPVDRAGDDPDDDER